MLFPLCPHLNVSVTSLIQGCWQLLKPDNKHGSLTLTVKMPLRMQQCQDARGRAAVMLNEYLKGKGTNQDAEMWDCTLCEKRHSIVNWANEKYLLLFQFLFCNVESKYEHEGFRTYKRAENIAAQTWTENCRRAGWSRGDWCHHSTAKADCGKPLLITPKPSVILLHTSPPSPQGSTRGFLAIFNEHPIGMVLPSMHSISAGSLQKSLKLYQIDLNVLGFFHVSYIHRYW